VYVREKRNKFKDAIGTHIGNGDKCVLILVRAWIGMGLHSYTSDLSFDRTENQT